jgi:hypothetical protein
MNRLAALSDSIVCSCNGDAAVMDEGLEKRPSPPLVLQEELKLEPRRVSFGPHTAGVMLPLLSSLVVAVVGVDDGGSRGGDKGGDKNSDRRVISAEIFFRTLSPFFAATELVSVDAGGRFRQASSSVASPPSAPSPLGNEGSGVEGGEVSLGGATRSDVEVAESFFTRADFFLSQRPRGGRGGAVGSGGN